MVMKVNETFIWSYLKYLLSTNFKLLHNYTAVFQYSSGTLKEHKILIYSFFQHCKAMPYVEVFEGKGPVLIQVRAHK